MKIFCTDQKSHEHSLLRDFDARFIWRRVAEIADYLPKPPAPSS